MLSNYARVHCELCSALVLLALGLQDHRVTYRLEHRNLSTLEIVVWFYILAIIVALQFCEFRRHAFASLRHVLARRRCQGWSLLRHLLLFRYSLLNGLHDFGRLDHGGGGRAFA